MNFLFMYTLVATPFPLSSLQAYNPKENFFVLSGTVFLKERYPLV